MKQIGVIILSYEEAGDLSGIIPWKTDNPYQVYQSLLEQKIPVNGFIFLSTCNRVEIIYTLEDPEYHPGMLNTMLDTMPELDAGILPTQVTGRRAVRHLLRLSSGLESMVLGETEIRAQIKDAFEDAKEYSLLDKRLRVLFQYIFQESRKIRNSIPIANLPISVATLATRNMMRYYGERETEDPVLIIGSGPMSRQAAEYLRKAGRKIALVNRTLARVEELARRTDAKLFSFQEFLDSPESIGPISGIVTATSRNDAFITTELVQRIQKLRPDRVEPLVIVDMALPPDVSPDCGKLPGTELISMETLRTELEENKQKRVMAAQMANEHIEDSIFRIEANLVTDMSSDIVKELQRDIRERSRAKLENLLEERLSHLSRKDRNLIYTWAIQAHREMNRIHRKGLESVIKNYCATNISGEIHVSGDH